MTGNDDDLPAGRSEQNDEQTECQLADFATRLRKMMSEKKMTQADFGEAMDLSRGAVSQWLIGATTPGIERLQKLAGVLGVDPAWLAFGREIPPVAEPEEKRSKVPAVMPQDDLAPLLALARIDLEHERSRAVHYLALAQLLAYALRDLQALPGNKPAADQANAALSAARQERLIS